MFIVGGEPRSLPASTQSATDLINIHNAACVWAREGGTGGSIVQQSQYLYSAEGRLDL